MCPKCKELTLHTWQSKHLENRLNWFEEGQQITIVDGEITFSTVSSTIWHEIIGSCAVCNHDCIDLFYDKDVGMIYQKVKQ
jgi:hypothetical protein